MIIQAYNSTEILKICDDLKSIEKRLNIKGKMYDFIYTCLLFLFIFFPLNVPSKGL